MSIDVVVVGSVAFDNLQTPKGKRERALGGSAVYFSTVASYFARIGLVGVAGKDFDSEHIGFLKSHGVDLDGFEQVEGETFFWKGSYGEEFGDAVTHSTCLNVFEKFEPKLPVKYKEAPILFLANIHPSLQFDVISKMTNPRLIAMDTMNFWITSALKELKRVIRKVDVLFLNHQEMLQLSNEKKFAPAVQKLLTMGPGRIVVKMGELGAMTATGDSWFYTPAFPCFDISDPTGAGDSFAGGFIGSLAKSMDFSEAGFRKSMLFGSAMGSITVENFSVDSYRDLKFSEIEKRFEKVRGMLNPDVVA